MKVCDIIISAFTGGIASLGIWWLTTKYWVPKLNFSDKISKLTTKDNPSGKLYRFKFENRSCWRVFDSEIIVKLRIKGIKERLPNNWEVVYLPTSTLSYEKVAIIEPVSKGQPRPILEIKTYECDYFQKPFFGKEINDKSRAKTLTLEDVMALGKEAELQIMIIGTSEFSGARKFQLKTYKKEDIVEGCFGKNSLKIAKGK
jgi:hypothetical protein